MVVSFLINKLWLKPYLLRANRTGTVNDFLFSEVFTQRTGEKKNVNKDKRYSHNFTKLHFSLFEQKSKKGKIMKCIKCSSLICIVFCMQFSYKRSWHEDMEMFITSEENVYDENFHDWASQIPIKFRAANMTDNKRRDFAGILYPSTRIHSPDIANHQR